MSNASVKDAVDQFRKNKNGQVVLVLQGGGALGAYQVGVYQALHEAGVEPDWIIGTSIGAINAALIAGNNPESRLARLEEFWRRVRSPRAALVPHLPGVSEAWSSWSTLVSGISAAAAHKCGARMYGLAGSRTVASTGWCSSFAACRARKSRDS